MRLKIAFVLLGVVSLLFLGVAAGFSQDGEEAADNQSEAANNTDTQIVEQAPAAQTSEPSSAASDVQWLWGETVSVDPSKQELVVKYTDYDTDMEKDATVVITDSTVFDGGKGLAEINPHDMVSIDYTIDNSGRYVAKNIGTENSETAPPQE
ncbi:MAG: DUF5666 domain-containing protein [Candidatus Omnitrophota bacterium]